MITTTQTKIAALLLATTLALPTATYAAGKHYSEKLNVMVSVSKEIRLATNIYTPKKVKRGPVVLIRTPYGSQTMPWAMEPLAEAGFIVVTQDVRGMGRSEGMFIPFLKDREDGIKTLDWIAKQPWCDGNIGMWGSSYLAYCALVVLPEGHPNLKAVFNLSGWGSSSGMALPGGAMHLMIGAPWSLSGQISGQSKSGKATWDDAFRHIPVVDLPSVFGIQSERWNGMVSLYEGGELDQVAGIFNRCDKIHVPIFHMTGWFDFVGKQTIDTYECIDAHANKNGAQQVLRIGPWRHDQIWQDGVAIVGDENFGSASVMGVDKVMAEAVRWFDRHLKNKHNGIAKEKPVQVFVMGDNKWQNFDAWPPKNVELQKWHFESDGNARTASGNGRLAVTTSAGSQYDEFVFDPMNPVPTLGGSNSHFFPDNLGVKDQREIEKRDDVLVYTSATLDDDLS